MITIMRECATKAKSLEDTNMSFVEVFEEISKSAKNAADDPTAAQPADLDRQSRCRRQRSVQPTVRQSAPASRRPDQWTKMPTRRRIERPLLQKNNSILMLH